MAGAAQTPPRRRLKPDQRRALIVAAAAEEFGRRGHRAARLEDIARAAGVTKSVLYDHFPGKEALVAEVVARAGREYLAEVAAAIQPAGGPEARFRAALLATFRVIAARADVRMLLLGAHAAGEPAAKASVSALRTSRTAMAAVYLSEPSFLAGRPDRQERAEAIAHAGIGTVNALAALGIERDLTPEELTEIAFDLLYPGLAAMSGPGR